MPEPKPIRFECPSCHVRVQVAYCDRHKAFRCPACNDLIELAPHQKVLPQIEDTLRQKVIPQMKQSLREHSERRRAKRMAKERETQLREAQRQQALVRAEKNRQAEITRQSHYRAVMSGHVFDATLLVEEFRADWVRIQEATELTPIQISHGIKSASPLAGLGAGYLTGNPWVGVAVAVGTFLASGYVGQEYAREKFLEWRAKWVRLFSGCSAPQLEEFAQALLSRYPLIYHGLNADGQTMLP